MAYIPMPEEQGIYAMNDKTPVPFQAARPR